MRYKPLVPRGAFLGDPAPPAGCLCRPLCDLRNHDRPAMTKPTTRDMRRARCPQCGRWARWDPPAARWICARESCGWVGPSPGPVVLPPGWTNEGIGRVVCEPEEQKA